MNCARLTYHCCAFSFKRLRVRMDPIAAVNASPLLKSCGFDAATVESSAAQWKEASSLILEALKFDAASLTEAQSTRVYHYYLPIVMWIQHLLKQKTEPGPMVLGISAPQGCGKSTLVECLFEVFGKMGKRAASVSIDDFYLTHADQNQLAEKHSDNPLLQCRGNALTHEVSLGNDTLQQLKGRGTSWNH